MHPMLLVHCESTSEILAVITRHSDPICGEARCYVIVTNLDKLYEPQTALSLKYTTLYIISKIHSEARCR